MKVVVVLVALVVGLVLHVTREVEIVGKTSDGYDLVELYTPPLSKWWGKGFTEFVLKRSPFRQVLARFILNDNELFRVRELAAAFPMVAPVYYPMRRLNDAQYQEHVEMRKTQDDALSATSSSSLYHSIADFHAYYKNNKGTPTEVMKRLIQGYDQLNDRLKIFSSFKREEILAQAKESDKRWANNQPLSIFDGVPVAVKDMVDAKGHVIYGGSATGDMSNVDDTIIERFRKAGAIFVGMTTMTQGGMSPFGYNPLLLGPFNPFDERFYSGGSSSGSALAVATGLVPVAVGFDGGGSIRLPASLSGLYGLASTFGRIPFERDAPVFTTVKAGPIAATVQDVALTHMLLAEPKIPHFYSELYSGNSETHPLPPPHLHKYQAVDSLKDVTIGVYWDHFKDSDKEIYEANLEALNYLVQTKGAKLVNITIPNLRAISLSHSILIGTEFALLWDEKYYQNDYAFEMNADLILTVSKSMTGNENLAAQRVRAVAMQQMNEIFQSGIDVIFSPTSSINVPQIPENSPEGEANANLIAKLLKFIFMANVCGIPAISVPIGHSPQNKLPIGAQFLANHWNEHKLLRMANALSTNFESKRQIPTKNHVDLLRN